MKRDQETIMQTTLEGIGAVDRESEGAAVHFSLATSRAHLVPCLDRLLPPHREVIELVDFLSKSLKEASEIVGIPQATLRTRLFYARKALGDLLKYQYVDRIAA
jgi:RNA polymerase sigma-70 factor (ECF subfamily)